MVGQYTFGTVALITFALGGGNLVKGIGKDDSKSSCPSERESGFQERFNIHHAFTRTSMAGMG